MPVQDTARFRARLVLIVALVVLAVTGGLAVDAGVKISHAKSDANERARLAALAGQVAVDFTSIDYRTFTQNMAHVAAGATPDFAKKYKTTINAFAPLYRRGKVILTTSVQAAGISSLSAKAAVAVVTLSSSETSATTTSPITQELRMQIGLQKIGKRWLASQVQQL